MALLLMTLFWGIVEAIEAKEAILTGSPSSVKPGDEITLTFQGAPGNLQDWVTLVPVEAVKELYGEWYFLGGKREGQLSSRAPKKEGDYEFRLFADWPAGGYEVLARSNAITVGKGPLVGAESVSPAPTGPCSEIVGSWSWFDGGVVTVRSDGTIEHDISGNSGRWECIDPDERTFTLRWERGDWVDTLTLSVDGNELQGTNNAGMSVSGRRVKPEPEFEPPSVTILEDGFDSEHGGRGQLNYSGFINWEVTKGTVDLIGHGFWDVFPDHGLYLDLDGSTREAGRLESKTVFKLDPGKYRLEFDLAGSPMSGPNTVTVSLGNLYTEDFTLAVKEPFRTIARTIRVPTTTSAKLIFDHSGGDNEGLILDNVKLTKVSGEILEEEEGVLDLSEAPEEWAREWTVLSTLLDFLGGKAGFYPEAERSGDANPNPGREGILYLHPVSKEEPARISRRITLTGPRPTLSIGVSGNRDVDGDFALVVKVNGEPLEEEKIIAGAQGWQDQTFDLSAYSGKTVTIEIEARANNWYYEYVFFDYIRVDEGSVGPLPTPYKDAFRLSTGELIMGELLSFDGSSFRIKTEKGVIEKKREEIATILVGIAQ